MDGKQFKYEYIGLFLWTFNHVQCHQSMLLCLYFTDIYNKIKQIGFDKTNYT